MPHPRATSAGPSTRGAAGTVRGDTTTVVAHELRSAPVAQVGPPLPPLPPHPADATWPTEAWPTGEPGPDLDGERPAALLDERVDHDRAGRLGETRAVVVAHRGRVVAERHAPGVDAGRAHRSWSTAKSVTHDWAGILVGQGRLDASARADVREWAGPADLRHAVTVEDLLRICSAASPCPRRTRRPRGPAAPIEEVLLAVLDCVGG